MNQYPVFTDIFPFSLQRWLRAVFHSPFSGPVSVDLETLARSLDNNRMESPFVKWLNKTEREQFSSFTFRKRYVEWLGGRLCAKKALTDYIQKFHSLQIIPPPSEMVVLSHQTGRPYFQCDQLKKASIGPDLSISHCGKYALAFVSKSWCGIDIQEMQPSLVKVKGKYCGKEEEEHLRSFLLTPDIQQLHCLTLLWAAKEALRKMFSHLKLIGFLDMSLRRIEIMDEGTFIFIMQLYDKTLLPQGKIEVLTTLCHPVGAAFCQLPETKETTDQYAMRDNA